MYSRVSFCDGSFYDDSLLLRHLSRRTEHSRLVEQYSMVSFCDGSFYDDSLLLRPLSSRAKHSRLVVHHCRNSSVLSVLKCASRSFPVCMCFFFFYFSAVLLSWLWFFPPMTSIKKTEKKKKSKQLTLHSVLVSSEPRPGPSSAKLKVTWLIFFSIICVIFYEPNSLN